MKSKIQLLRTIFYLPPFIAILRLLLTLAVILWNPLGMSLRFIQLIPFLILVVVLFCYLKLYMEPVPVVTLLGSSIVHFLLILLFKRQFELVPFIPLFILDVIYIVVMSFKISMYPFEIEGEDDGAEDDYSDITGED